MIIDQLKIEVYGKIELRAASTSRISALVSVITVASFRTWRGSQLNVAKEPILAAISSMVAVEKYHLNKIIDQSIGSKNT